MPRQADKRKRSEPACAARLSPLVYRRARQLAVLLSSDELPIAACHALIDAVNDLGNETGVSVASPELARAAYLLMVARIRESNACAGSASDEQQRILQAHRELLSVLERIAAGEFAATRARKRAASNGKPSTQGER